MDLADTMKQVLSSGGSVSNKAHHQHIQQQLNAAAVAASGSGLQTQQTSVGGSGAGADTGAGYVTEKLYMLLQLYLQNKGWNPSVELLQCFSELKDSAMLPSAGYLQVLANRLALDSQGRLVLRESGKIVLPYEHFANAVMLKHMTGPHGLHLSVEATVRAVIDSYTIGRENFGMEKEFIIEVVQSCPNPACRYYKNHMGVAPPSFMDPAAFQAAAAAQMTSEYMQQHLPSQIGGAATMPLTNSAIPSAANADPSAIDKSGVAVQMDLSMAKGRSSDRHDKHAKGLSTQQQHAQAQAQQQQQLTAAIIQQQNRAIAQQNLEKFGNLSAIEKQRVLQQLDKKHYEAVAAAAAVASGGLASSQNLSQQMHTMHERSSANIVPPINSPHSLHMASSTPPINPLQGAAVASHIQSSIINEVVPATFSKSDFYRSASVGGHDIMPVVSSPASSGASSSAAMDSNSSTNKDLLALHNGAWAQTTSTSASSALSSPVITATAPIITMPSDSPHTQQLAAAGQEKIIRAFGELMRNMARMKTYIRPSMCKPYGKQSEGLQKTLGDTIQLVQSLRSCLPAPHIPVSSWKTEDRHGEPIYNVPDPYRSHC